MLILKLTSDIGGSWDASVKQKLVKHGSSPALWGETQPHVTLHTYTDTRWEPRDS